MQTTLERPVELSQPSEIAQSEIDPKPAKLTFEEKLALLLATPVRFKQWLESKPANALVGYTAQSSSCPIHTWLKSEGYDNAVGSRTVRVKSELRWRRLLFWELPNEIKYQLPIWASLFVLNIDAKGYNTKGTPIQATEALRTLNIVAPAKD